MKALEAPNTHFLNAAVGWLELGNLREAKAELAQLPLDCQHHPDVLEVRWLACVEERTWDLALEIARALLQAAPERPSGWLHQAYALRRVKDGGVERAWEALRPAYEKFPEEPTIPYNLSCYACQMQQLEAARLWLKRASRIAGNEQIKAMALRDPDLEPLWAEIAQS